MWAGLLLMLTGCRGNDASIVVYVSVDRDVAAPVLETFTARTGIKVRAAYDSEANKTVGLVNRLLAERGTPRADVFWNAEPVRTVELCRRGVLAPLQEPVAPMSGLDDPQGCWRAFAGRVRVFLLSQDRFHGGSLGLADLTAARWRDRACIANPHFGSTGTHFAAIYASLGEASFRDWIRGMRNNGVAMLPGNAQVKEAVMQGSCWLGLTDSDDAQAALAERASVQMVIPDQQQGQGTFIIASTVALVRGASHEASAKRFIDFLLSTDAEAALAGSRAVFLPLRHPELRASSSLRPLQHVVVVESNLEMMVDAYPKMLRAVEAEWRLP